MPTLVNNNLSFVSIGSSINTNIASTANTAFLENLSTANPWASGGNERQKAIPNTQTLKTAYKFNLEAAGPQNINANTFPELLQPPYNIGNGAGGEWRLCTNDLTISGAPGVKRIYKDLYDYQPYVLQEMMIGYGNTSNNQLNFLQLNNYNTAGLPTGATFYTKERHPLYKTNLDPNALRYGPTYSNQAIFYEGNASLHLSEAEWGYYNNVPEPEPFIFEIQNSLAQASNASSDGAGLGSNLFQDWGTNGNPYTHKVFSFSHVVHEGYIHASASLLQGNSSDSQWYDGGAQSYSSTYGWYNSSWANKDFASNMYDAVEADYILDGISWDVDGNGDQLNTGYNSEYDMKFTSEASNSGLRRWPTVASLAPAGQALSTMNQFLKYVVLFNTHGVQTREEWLQDGFNVTNLYPDYYGKEQNTVGVSGNKVIAIAILSDGIAPNGQGKLTNTQGEYSQVTTTTIFRQNQLTTPSAANGWQSNFIEEIDFEGEAKFLQTS